MVSVLHRGMCYKRRGGGKSVCTSNSRKLTQAHMLASEAISQAVLSTQANTTRTASQLQPAGLFMSRHPRVGQMVHKFWE